MTARVRVGVGARALALAIALPLGCGAPSENELEGRSDLATAEAILERSLAAYQQVTEYSDEGQVIAIAERRATILGRALFRTRFSRGAETQFVLHPQPEWEPAASYLDVSQRLLYSLRGDGDVAWIFNEEGSMDEISTLLPAAVSRGWRGSRSLAEHVTRTALAALAAEEQDEGNPSFELYDLRLVLPPERPDCYEIHATDARGWQITLFIHTADFLLREWRQQAEFPPLRWEDNPLRWELANATKYERAILAPRLVPHTEPEYIERIDITFAPEVGTPGPELEKDAPHLAVPVVAAAPVWRSSTAASTRPLDVDGIGITLASSSDGWAVGKTFPGPARRVGVRRGDLIVEVDGIDVTRHGRGSVTYLIGGEPGTSVRLTLLRDHHLVEVSMARERLRFYSPAVLDGL